MPVPRAEVRLLVWRDSIGEPWESRSFLGSTFAETANADGVVQIFVSSGRVRAWARAPDGGFGSSRIGDLLPGEDTDLGDLIVAAQVAVHRLVVTSPSGTPVAGALVRFDVEHAVQRFATESRGDMIVHDRTNGEGRVEFRSTLGPQPLVMGVAAPGYQPVSILLDRSGSDAPPYHLSLVPLPHLKIRFETADGERVDEKIDVVFQISQVRDNGAFALPSFVPRTVILGRVAPSVGQGALEELDPRPVEFLPRPTLGEATFDSESGVYALEVPTAGRYLVRGLVTPGLRLEANANVGDAEPVVLRLPRGRRVDVVGEADGQPMSFSQWCVWAATADVPAQDWPANKEEALDAGRTGARFFQDESLEASLWFPDGYTHLAYRRFEGRILLPRLTVRLPESHPVPGLHRVPGSDQEYGRERTERVAVPTGRHVRVSAVLTPESDIRGSGRVRVQAVLAGAPLAQPGIEIRARRVAPAPGFQPTAGTPSVFKARTDERGVATFLLPPGEYRVYYSPSLARPIPGVVVVVQPGKGVEETRLPFGG